MSRIEVGNTPIRYVPIKSRRFLCSKCLEFVIEHTLVVRRGMGKQYWEEKRRERNLAIARKRGMAGGFTKTKLECPNGCSARDTNWTVHDVSTGTAKKFKP